MGAGAGEEAGAGARARAGEYRSLAARAGDRDRARAAVSAAAGRRREGAGRALAAGAAQTAGFRRAVAELAQAALEKQRARPAGGARGEARAPGAWPPPAPGGSSPELERFKKRVQECQVRRLQEQVQEQRHQLEERGEGRGGEGGEPPAPEFLQVLEAQTTRLSEITRQIGRIESILSPGRAKEQALRERIRAVCEEHEQAEGAGGGAGGGTGGGAGEHAPPALAGASTHRARGAGTGGGQAQAEAEALDAVEPPGVPQQEAGSPPSPPGEAPSEPEGGGEVARVRGAKASGGLCGRSRRAATLRRGPPRTCSGSSAASMALSLRLWERGAGRQQTRTPVSGRRSVASPPPRQSRSRDIGSFT